MSTHAKTMRAALNYGNLPTSHRASWVAQMPAANEVVRRPQLPTRRTVGAMGPKPGNPEWRASCAKAILQLGVVSNMGKAQTRDLARKSGYSDEEIDAAYELMKG